MRLPQRLLSAQETEIHLEGNVYGIRCRSFEHVWSVRRSRPPMLPQASSQEQVQLQASVSFYQHGGRDCLLLASAQEKTSESLNNLVKGHLLGLKIIVKLEMPRH